MCSFKNNALLTLMRIIVLVTAFVLWGADLFAAGPSKTSGDPAQDLMRYAGNIHQFNSIYPQEKVFLQFDNTSYYPGETIWFKAFVVNASTLQRSKSKVLYVDLLSPEGVLLMQQKLLIVAGQADGSFPLNDASTAQARDLRGGAMAYPSGFYEVRAYTNYMQNFDNDAIFSRVLAVFDKPKQEGHYYDEKPEITYKFTANIQPVRPETPKQKKVNAYFYPEGGHIIIGQPCRVAFKVTGDNGMGIDATGSLDDISFSTQHDGMGYFVFTPQSKRNSVKITVDGHNHSYSLPDAEQSGCTVQSVSQHDKASFTIYSSSDFISQELGMTLTCRGELVDFAKVTIGGNVTEQTFDLSSAPEGVVRFTLFNKAGDILASRSFYHERADAVIPSINVTSGKTAYAPFEKITLNFNLTDGKGSPFRDRFCLSVRDTRSPVSIFEDDLRTNLLLSSDLRGFIERPEYYFNTTNQNRLSDLDLLCMVQGWERYDWQTMSGVKSFEESFRLEDKGLTLNGWVLKSTGRQPLSRIEVNASLVPEDKTLTESYRYITGDNGYFGFDIGVLFYDKARLSIKASPRDRKMRKEAITIMFDRAKTPMVRPYLPGETMYITKTIRSTAKQNNTAQSNDEFELINVDKGIILPDVEINEDRKYVDYYTFQAYDVLKDVEKVYDKGDFSTDLYGYIKDLGYDVRIGFEFKAETIFARRPPIQFDYKLLINGLYTFIYAHTETLYMDLDEDTALTGEDPSVIGSRIDTRDIKSIMVYNRPMFLSKAMELAPLRMKKGRGFEDIMMVGATKFNKGMVYNDDKMVYMVDVLLKNIDESSPRKEQFDRSRRFTTVDGYSRPFSFYSPEYPNGPIPGEVDNRRTLYWNPNVITDKDGKAQVEFYNNSSTTHFNISAAGMTASGTPYTLNQDW